MKKKHKQISSRIVDENIQPTKHDEMQNRIKNATIFNGRIVQAKKKHRERYTIQQIRFICREYSRFGCQREKMREIQKNKKMQKGTYSLFKS